LVAGKKRGKTFGEPRALVGKGERVQKGKREGVQKPRSIEATRIDSHGTEV